jgi:hypothetical protein
MMQRKQQWKLVDDMHVDDFDKLEPVVITKKNKLLVTIQLFWPPSAFCPQPIFKLDSIAECEAIQLDVPLPLNVFNLCLHVLVPDIK